MWHLKNKLRYIYTSYQTPVQITEKQTLDQLLDSKNVLIAGREKKHIHWDLPQTAEARPQL